MRLKTSDSLSHGRLFALQCPKGIWLRWGRCDTKRSVRHLWSALVWISSAVGQHAQECRSMWTDSSCEDNKASPGLRFRSKQTAPRNKKKHLFSKVATNKHNNKRHGESYSHPTGRLCDTPLNFGSAEWRSLCTVPSCFITQWKCLEKWNITDELLVLVIFDEQNKSLLLAYCYGAKKRNHRRYYFGAPRSFYKKCDEKLTFRKPNTSF